MNQSQNKKRKISVVQIVRHVIQLIAFFLFPGLVIDTYAAFKHIVMALVGGTFTWQTMCGDVYLLIAVVPITILFGRFFCGFLCSFGAMGDLFYFLSGLVMKKRPVIPPKVDRILKYLKYLILVLLIVFVWILGTEIPAVLNPWHVFGVYSNIFAITSWETALGVGGILLLAIIVLSFFYERFFCRYLCPLGAIFSLIARVRLFKIKKKESACVHCNLCNRKCSMGVEVAEKEQVKSGECIECMKCIDACPTDALKTNIKPVVAGTVTAAAITGLYFAGNVLAVAQTANSVAVENITAGTGQYKDGVYQGSAEGFRGPIEVEVTVEGGCITQIDVISSKDDARYMNMVKNTVIADIISTQSPDVDTVSGATFTSEGIIGAVKQALSEMSADENTNAGKEIESQTEQSTESSTTDKAASGSVAAALADGTYTGSGSGYRGTTSVSVTVKSGQITDITIESYQDDAPYFRRAESAIPTAIISAQSLDVDTVSGATFSSRSIIEAVADALNVTYENSNDAIAGEHVPGGGGRGGNGPGGGGHGGPHK